MLQKGRCFVCCFFIKRTAILTMQKRMVNSYTVVGRAEYVRANVILRKDNTKYEKVGHETCSL